MMVERDLRGDLKQLDIGATEHVIADLGVGFHDGPFVGIQLARFVQDGIRNTDLPDIVQWRGSFE